MAKLLRREIDAIMSEILKANEYKDSIDYEAFRDELQVLEVVKEFVKGRDELFEQIQEVENNLENWVKANDLETLVQTSTSYYKPKSSKGSVGKFNNNPEYNLLLKKGLINPPNHINRQDLENYIVIHNNGDLSDLLEKAKQHFNI
jgi:hypothetical protein